MACRSCLALPRTDLGRTFSTLAVLCPQQPCCRVLGQTSCSACQKPSAPSPVASSGSITSPFSSRRRSSSTAPALGTLAKAVLNGQQLLSAARVGPDQDQEALPLVIEPRGEVDAIGPEIHVAPGGQIALLPACVLLLPSLGEAPHGRRGETGCFGTEQRRQRFLELPGRDTLQ